MASTIKNYAKHGSLKTKLTCRNILWSVSDFLKVYEEAKAIRSDFFRVSTLPNCLFYLALKSEIEKHIFKIYVHRCTNNIMTHKCNEFTANILIEFEDIHKKPHFTKSFGMTQDLSYIQTQYDYNEIDNILTHNDLQIHCSIIVKENVSEGSYVNSDTFKEKILSQCSVISANELTDHIRVLLEGDTSNEVILKVDNEEFPVHKNMLCSLSPVFSAMFNHETLEKQQKLVLINDIRKEVMGELIKYVYTGTTSELPPDVTIELYIAADKYGISDLRERCRTFLVASLSQELVLDVLVLSHQHGDENLKTAAVRYLVEKAPTLLESDSFTSFIQSECEIVQDFILMLVRQSVK